MKNKKYIIYLLVTILTLSIGLTYAYFKGRVTGEEKDISLKSKGIYVLYSGDATLASESISPGWSITKEFTIENQGSNNETYDIYIEKLINTFVTEGYLQYKITSSSGYNMTEYKDIPKSETSTDTVLAYSVPIKPNEKQTYKIELIYKDTEEDQSADIGKILNGVLGIKIPSIVRINILENYENNNYTDMKAYIYSNSSYLYTIPFNGKDMDSSSIIDDIDLENYEIKCNNNYKIENNILTIIDIQSDTTCTINYKKKRLTLAKAMLRDNPTINERTDFSVINVENTTGILYQTNKTEDSSTVYYYLGNTTNNWVKFGKYITTDTTNSLWNENDDMYWRIIRTNEDGSVRLLYSGTSPDGINGHIGKIRFNNNYDKPINSGYMYGTTGTLEKNRQNTNDSLIKEYIDTWYKNNLLNDYNKYISKSAIYCNDRSVGNGTYTTNSSGSFDYGAYTRLINFTPSYRCGDNGNGGLFESTQAIEDKFSASTNGGGNGQLKYPIALMTSDEVMFAGGKNQTNLKSPYAWYYTNSVGTSISNTTWYLLSPSLFRGTTLSGCRVFDSMYPGYLFGNGVNGTYGVRPVISIDKCAYVASGDGTPDNPYTIDETSCQ